MWTPSDHQYLESAVQHLYHHVNGRPLTSQQLAGRGGRAMESNAAQAFLFFNLVDNVSYFVQLQSWSLIEEKSQITKKSQKNSGQIEPMWASFFLVSPKSTGLSQTAGSCSEASSSTFYMTDGHLGKCLSSLVSLNISCSCDSWGENTVTAMTGLPWTHHDAFGLFVCSLLHQAGQLTEVSLVLLEQTWSSVAEHIHRLLVTIASH